MTPAGAWPCAWIRAWSTPEGFEGSDGSDERPGAAAIRAAVETIAPAREGRPGGVELGADRHVVDLIDLALPGFVDMIGMLLDAYATDVRAGASFVELSPDERGEVLRLMASGEIQDVRDAVDALFVFTYGGDVLGVERLRPGDGHARAAGRRGPTLGISRPGRRHRRVPV